MKTQDIQATRTRNGEYGWMIGKNRYRVIRDAKHWRLYKNMEFMVNVSTIKVGKMASLGYAN